MMKNKINNMRAFHKIIALAFIAAITFSCVGDDDFTVPTFNDTTPITVDGNVVALSTVASRLAQSGDDTFTFEQSASGVDEYITGYVISDDQGGNWFKELIIQDETENPTAGLAISIDVNPLFTRYEFGRKVFVKLTGLTVGTSNGVTTLGVAGAGSDIERIAASSEADVIKRDNLVADIVPVDVEFADFSDALELIWVRVNNVQFVEEQIDLSFAAESFDQFDGERSIKSCNDAFGATANLWTSTFSDFKALNIPDGKGSISAVLTRDFFDDVYVLYVNTPEDFDLTDTNRCDLTPVSCGNAAAAGPNTLLSENFETQSTGAAAMPAGWTNFQEAGTETWEVYTSGGTNASLGKSVNVGSFNSNDASTIAWLITPEFDFDAQTGEVFSFETSNSFSDGSTMQVLYSDDWDGTTAGIATATWKPLADATIVDDGEFFGNWVFSDNVSLDCVTGTGHIAFRYEGSGDSGTDGTYELDNISMTSN
ncbi:hypothetical protein JCM19314_2811 [Nonlabens ulvanivorans]|uniref:DUF5689 domain-containing protein n=1 Tax=Nonlabens ulvanivorans TaxID=906888 RepID=A0A081D7K7_NONUL|nr:hypothetical protein JCM19296_481 [Nonlabens ulvanivorans]GAK98780.1 hypothetical protein JCM19314_2811 [Nonlabens ulvanivorans]